MEYIFAVADAGSRFVSIELMVDGPFPESGFDLQLPSWRPGRYELGNFAKNIKSFSVADAGGNPVPFKKVTKDRWHVAGGGEKIKVSYQYYANQPDAGACYADHELLYINPVHCCFFIPGREDEKCTVTLKVPSDWKVATGMPVKNKHILEAVSFDHLVDCPFMASPSISHAHYTLDGITFNIWIQGTSNPDWPAIIKDFEAFTAVQLHTMKEFPAKDYHFLVLLVPFPFYHGVEHLNSTVLALGPGYKLMQPAMYKELLGVASHELFHSWNVKSIRPVEMLPYNFTAENYAETGYVYEGVTTYYGDLFLARSGFFNLEKLLSEYSVRLQKHADNPGIFNYSVAESSFDTWLDGYTPGVPGRKTSIYDEGCLLALVLDFMIRSATSHTQSLDEVMRVLYFDFAKKNKGYSGADYRAVAEKIAGRSFNDYFENYVYKACSLITLLGEVVSLAGIKLKESPSQINQEKFWGLKTETRNGLTYASAIFPGSPAQASGIAKDDELIAINNYRIENNLSELIEMQASNNFELTLSTFRKLRTVTIRNSEKHFYSKYTLEPEQNCTHAQLMFRQSWLELDK